MSEEDVVEVPLTEPTIEETSPTLTFPPTTTRTTTINRSLSRCNSLAQDESFIQDYNEDEDTTLITKGREIARDLMDRDWYYPNGGKPDSDSDGHGDGDGSDGGDGKGGVISKTDLDAGWAFFEHQGLPRCLVNKKHRNGGFVRAKRGESVEETKLYSYWTTKHRDMSDFGIGIGLYFTTLRFFALVFIIVGFLNIPTMMFLAGENDYATDRRVDIRDWTMRATMVCNDASFVPCPTCTEDEVLGLAKSANDRLGLFNVETTENGVTTTEQLTFVLKNHCELSSTFGWIVFASMLFLVTAVYVFLVSQRRWIAKFDEGEQTSSDYSIRIANPPKDARDPEEWKEFFESKFEDSHVTVCTVVLDNEELLQALAERRKLLRKIENLVPKGETYDEDNLEETVQACPQEVPCWKKILCCAKPPHKMLERIRELDQDITDLCGTDFNVADVFITFETEQAQRKVLEEMTYPLWLKGLASDEYRFKNKYLYVIEPDEPSSIRWQDLDDNKCKQAKKQASSIFFSALLIAAGAFLIYLAHLYSPNLYGITVVIMNTITPILVRLISSSESHSNQTSKATSVYLKITAFRWINTVILLPIITPFTQTLQDGDYLIRSVRALYITELTTKPILQIVDIIGNLKRHYFAPRAKDQRRMNSYFLPGPVSIEERYTDATKVFFLTAVYGILFPPAYFFTGIIYLLGYQLDKFLLLRSWGQGPKINSSISKFSGYFLLACVICYSCVAAYIFAEFPFDNACESNDDFSSYIGTFSSSSLLNVDNEVIANDEFTISASDSSAYKFCNQDLARFRPDAYPPTPRKGGGIQYDWMSPLQIQFAPYFAWTCVAMLSLVCATVFYKIVKNNIFPLFCNWYSPVGKATDFKFSNVKEIFGYVPQMQVPGYLFPFVLCDVDSIDKQLIGWSAYDDSFDSYNLIFDVPKVCEDMAKKREGEDGEKHYLFSTVKSWTPE